jgi:two-component system, cell cycle response regulator
LGPKVSEVRGEYRSTKGDWGRCKGEPRPSAPTNLRDLRLPGFQIALVHIGGRDSLFEQRICELVQPTHVTSVAQLDGAQLPDAIILELVDVERGLRELEAWVHTSHGVSTPVICAALDAEAAARAFDIGAADVVRPDVLAAELAARVAKAVTSALERRALTEMAQTDGLTGLANFRALNSRLEQEMKRAHRYQYPLSVAVVDLDGLKQINDRFGHVMGNRAIVGLAGHLRGNLRETDFAARFGGDEFVILLPHQHVAEAYAFAERVRVGLKSVRLCAELPVPLSVSIGVAMHSPQYFFQTGRELLAAADAALYQAKRSGRDRVVSEIAFHLEPDREQGAQP